MKVLIVYAHPEPLSMNGALRDAAVQTLHELAHEVERSGRRARGKICWVGG